MRSTQAENSTANLDETKSETLKEILKTEDEDGEEVNWQKMKGMQGTKMRTNQPRDKMPESRGADPRE
jgi:hypothetical protein